ncbi:MAG: hypothetical protein ND895_14165 [Pyrinomonadaceae bacterium]|nr:hypothetical protein [Pyrinomonadaceae bacterium]
MKRRMLFAFASLLTISCSMRVRSQSLQIYSSEPHIVERLSWPAFSQSVDRNFAESVSKSETDRRRQFIAAFDWSVDRSSDYIWPFESMGPAPYKSLWMVVEKMPSVWTERGKAKSAIPLSAYRSLRVNGHSLPRPQVSGSQEEFRVTLVNGRLRFSFSVPSGFRLDAKNTMIRIKLYQVG